MTPQERKAFEALRKALDHAEYELGTLLKCLKSGDGCPDGLDVHMPGMTSARKKARAALALANQSIYESRFWYGWKGSKVRAPKGKGR